MDYCPILNFISMLAVTVSSLYIVYHWRGYPHIATPFLFIAALYFSLGYRAITGITVLGSAYLFEAAGILFLGVLLVYVMSLLMRTPELRWVCIILLFIPFAYLTKPDAFFIVIVTGSMGYLLVFSAFISMLLFKKKLWGKLAASLGMSYAFLSIIYLILSMSVEIRYLPWYIPTLMLAASFIFMAYSFSTLPKEILHDHARYGSVRPVRPKSQARKGARRRRRPRSKAHP